MRRELGRALGVLQRGRAESGQRLTEAQRTVERLAHEHRGIGDAIGAALGDGSSGALPRWRELARSLAPGPASADWQHWPEAPGVPDGDPLLYRVGLLHRFADPAEAATGEPGADAAPEPDAAGPGGEAAAGWPVDDVPALVPLLGHGHLTIEHPGGRGTAATAEGLIGGLLLRLVAANPPGSVRIGLYDPVRLGAGLGGLLALARPGMLTSYAPHELDLLLKSLTREVRRIQETVLAGAFTDLAELAAATGKRPEPYRVIVLYAPAGGFPEQARAGLHSVARAGPPCGVHLICCGFGLDDIECTESVTVHRGGYATMSALPNLRLRPDPMPPAALLRAACEDLVNRAGERMAVRGFGELLPAEPWRESAADGLRVPIGDELDAPTDAPYQATLGDDPPHALIGGPSGSGKTNFLYVLIGALAARYHPDELEFYLLDFKEGVSFARFARGRKDPSWLPHAALVGVNINADREFGLALLRHLADQLRVRAEAAKEHEVTKLAELRGEDPAGRWPRIVAVIDEFQVLLGGRDKITEEAVTLLEDLARRGRSQGIHLVLASQDVGSVEALWGRSSILAQFTLRVALPKARRILAEDNRAAERIPRYCAVVNPESGVAGANHVVRLPDAAEPGALGRLQRELWDRRPQRCTEPKLFDGGVVPDLVTAPGYLALRPGAGTPSALVGQVIDLAGTPARIALRRAPGRNLAVLGTRAEEACDVLAAAALSLARQHRPDDAEFTLVCADGEFAPLVDELAGRLPAHRVETVPLSGVEDFLARTAQRVRDRVAGGRTPDTPEVPHYVVLFAMDAAGTRLAVKDPVTRGSGLDLLRTVAARGPETRTHLVGWWRTFGRLKEDIGGLTGRLDDIGAWVALDVPGADLAPVAGGLPVAWTPRERRALLFDRAAHDRPRPVIPYRTGEHPVGGAR